MNKHAYLILAHDSLSQLEELVAALDDPRNDIFVHIDAKADFDGSSLKNSKSELFILKHRINAAWGDFSLVNIEMDLLETATSNQEYQYYHIISGVDYPVKSQDYIHDFFDKHNGTEFIGFATHAPKEEVEWRSQHYFLFPRDFRSSNIFKKVLRAGFARLQSVMGYKRYPGTVHKGCQWCSITDEFARYLLVNRQEITKYFKNTYCPDELVIQTMCQDSKFKDKVFDSQVEFNGCLRYIKWIDGVLQLLDNESVEDMVNSPSLFARKFTSAGVQNRRKIDKLVKERKLR